MLLLATWHCSLVRFALPATHQHRTAALWFVQAENDEALLSEAPAVPFSGEEAMGRFLDLHELFQTYTNSKFGKQVLQQGAVWWDGGHGEDVLLPAVGMSLVTAESCFSASHDAAYVTRMAVQPPAMCTLCCVHHLLFHMALCSLIHMLRWTTTPTCLQSPTSAQPLARSGWAVPIGSTCRWGGALIGAGPR